jgi:hypothetical protein
VYHATKYMALPRILLHDPALQCLFLRLSGYKNQKSASKRNKKFQKKLSDPIKKSLTHKNKNSHVQRKMSRSRKIYKGQEKFIKVKENLLRSRKIYQGQENSIKVNKNILYYNPRKIYQNQGNLAKPSGKIQEIK